MKKIGYIVVLLMYSSLSLAAEQEAMEALIGLLEKMQSFQAQFSQKIRSSTGEKISNTKGEVVISRPNRFYWKSQQPDPIVVIADGRFLWTYDIDLEQVTKQDLNKALKDSPAALLAGSVDKFKQQFTIRYAKAGSCRVGAKEECFLLKPKQKESTFSNIVIGFDNHTLKEVSMSDPLGQHVYTVFSKVKTNAPVNKTLFTFSPPKGVDTIHYD